VKQFLKQGEAALYPNLQIIWERGHDPEIEILNCSGRSPQADVNSEVSERMDLAPFTSEDLHLLLQCFGLKPSGGGRKADAAALRVKWLPAGDAAVPECKRLRELGKAGSWWQWIQSASLKLLALAMVILLLFIMWRFCFADVRRSKRHLPWRGKVKDDDFPDEIGLSEL